MHKKINIVGAGITGLTIAAYLAKHNAKSSIFEKRAKIGGNCSSHFDNEIEVHDYGPHIFHTDNANVWKFMNSYAEFNLFQLNILAQYKNKKYHLPFGLDLVNSFFSKNLAPYELDGFLNTKRFLQIDSPKNFEEQALKLIGKELYEAFVKNYTTKQWNIDPKKLPASILQRLPFRNTYSNNYYNDRYQGIPVDGYQALFEKMASSPSISVKLSYDFSSDDIDPDQIYFYTGPIDRLLRYQFGPLEWRSLQFKYEKHDVDSYQGCAIVNYVEKEYPWTRIHEYKHFHPETVYSINETVICKEYPADYRVGSEPFYPIETDRNVQLYSKYRNELEAKFPNVILCGRLAQYRYLDMDDAIQNALCVAEEFLKKYI